MNSITLTGNVGYDPEPRNTESGLVVNLSLYVKTRRRNAEDDKFDLEIWGKTAEIARDYVRKGKQIAVQGSVRLEKFTKRDGTPDSKMVVRVNDLTLLGGREDGGSSAPAPAPRTVPAPAYAAAYAAADVPF